MNPLDTIRRAQLRLRAKQSPSITHLWDSFHSLHTATTPRMLAARHDVITSLLTHYLGTEVIEHLTWTRGALCSTAGSATYQWHILGDSRSALFATNEVTHLFYANQILHIELAAPTVQVTP